MYDDEYKEISRFDKQIHPDVKHRKNVENANLPLDEINSGDSLASAVNRFIYWLNGCRELVVWGKETRDLLEELLQKYEGISYHKIIAIQEDYVSKLSMYSFEKICNRLGITLRMPMNKGENNCERLCMLYRIVSNSPEWLSPRMTVSVMIDEKQYKKCSAHCKYAALVNGQAYHCKNCRFLKKRDDNEIILLFNDNHAMTLGYVPCKCCISTTSVSVRKKWDFDEIKEYCKALNMKCIIYPDSIQIKTEISSWLFQSETHTIVLYHENCYKRNNISNKKRKDYYHIQEKMFDDPMEAIFYIYCHDKAGNK